MPTTNAATVIPDGAVVVYGADSNIATNYDPGWGQSGNGQVDLRTIQGPAIWFWLIPTSITRVLKSKRRTCPT